MATYPILPSLSRGFSLDIAQNTEDGTIKDQMESGAVATRPRFTRDRRSWDANLRLLQLEDVRALDTFDRSVVRGGANAFYCPNLLPNGSFEFAALVPTDLVQGWYLSATNSYLSVAQSNATSTDGTYCIAATSPSTAFTLPASATQHSNLLQTTPTPQALMSVGDVYLFTAMIANTPGTIPSGVAFNKQFQVVWTYADGSTQSTSVSLPAGTYAWESFTHNFTTPASTSGAAPVAIAVNVLLNFQNTNGTATSCPANLFNLTIDQVALALITPQQNYGRMLGSTSPGVPVRFSKRPKFSDLGPADGFMAYGTSFSVTEV